MKLGMIKNYSMNSITAKPSLNKFIECPACLVYQKLFQHDNIERMMIVHSIIVIHPSRAI